MKRACMTAVGAGVTALIIGTTLDLATTSADAGYYRGHRRGSYGRRVGVGLAAGALAAGAVAASVGSYYNPYYGYGYYGSPDVGYPAYGTPGYGYYGYGY